MAAMTTAATKTTIPQDFALYMPSILFRFSYKIIIRRLRRLGNELCCLPDKTLRAAKPARQSDDSLS
jgi:hypothetical protein